MQDIDLLNSRQPYQFRKEGGNDSLQWCWFDYEDNKPSFGDTCHLPSDVFSRLSGRFEERPTSCDYYTREAAMRDFFKAFRQARPSVFQAIAESAEVEKEKTKNNPYCIGSQND